MEQRIKQLIFVFRMLMMSRTRLFLRKWMSVNYGYSSRKVMDMLE